MRSRIARQIPEVLVISRSDIMRLMTPSDYLAAVQEAFVAAEMGVASSPHPMHLPMPHGGFHAKGASMSLRRAYVAVKINGNFPGNSDSLGLPTIQGTIVLADGDNGVLLAILDSIEITLRRTAAASALAARLFAKPESQTLLVCGCGEQGRAHVAALLDVIAFKRCLVWDCSYEAAAALAGETTGTAGVEVIAAEDLRTASTSADVVVCCTTATKPFLDLDDVRPGTFIAAVGADSPAKSEIAPRLMAFATVITDDVRQCAEMGDLHHAIDAGHMSAADVHAALGQVLAGTKGGRLSPSQTIIFDSTGTGLQDVAAAAAVYERCIGAGSGKSIALA